MKNSSRLEEVIAINFSRSRIGVVFTSASRSTRRLNFSQLSSRLKKYSGRFRSALLTFTAFAAAVLSAVFSGAETPAAAFLIRFFFHNSRRFFYCGCRFLFGRHYIAFRFDSRFIFTFAHNDSTRSRRTLNPYTSSIINTLEAKVHSSRSRSALLTTSMVSSRLCRVTLHCWIFCI